MSLQTLQIAQTQAAKLLGIGPEELQKLQTKEIHRLGDVIFKGKAYPAFRAYTGPKGKIGKGGIRFANYPDIAAGIKVIKELSGEMYAKLGLRDHTDFRGAKGLVMIDSWKLSAKDKLEIGRQYELLMDEAGLAGYDKDVPAGDIGTNGVPDAYAKAYAKSHPEDPYRAAVITGKSPNNGGLGARAGATGLGAWAAQHTMMVARGEKRATVALQGFGNAGSWFAYHASTDPQRRIIIQAISEREGMLWTANPAGLIITLEMVKEIGDNISWTQPKLAALAKMIAKNQPGIKLETSKDSAKIFSFEADYFVPAAMGDTITEDNVKTLGARRGINEIANGPTTAGAHRYLMQTGKVVIPDFLSNSGGVQVSLAEWQADVDLAEGRIKKLPTLEDVESELRKSTTELTKKVLSMADKLGTKDLRVACAAFSMTRLLKPHKEKEEFALTA